MIFQLFCEQYNKQYFFFFVREQKLVSIWSRNSLFHGYLGKREKNRKKNRKFIYINQLDQYSIKTDIILKSLLFFIYPIFPLLFLYFSKILFQIVQNYLLPKMYFIHSPLGSATHDDVHVCLLSPQKSSFYILVATSRRSLLSHNFGRHYTSEDITFEKLSTKKLDAR